MGMGGRRMVAVVAGGVLAGGLVGGSSGGSGDGKGAVGAGSSAGPGSPAASAVTSAAAAVPTGAGGSASAVASASPGGAAGAGGSATPVVAAPSADLEGTLLDDKVVGQVLPDAKVMAGWDEEKRKVDTADHSVTCSTSTPCTGKPLSGSVRFSSGDLVTRFLVETLPSRDAARNRLKETYASYPVGPFHKVDAPALGSESQVFVGPLSAGDGVSTVVRSGTVVASVTTEGGPVDLPAARRFAVMLVKRIEQAQAGKTPDAGLGAA